MRPFQNKIKEIETKIEEIEKGEKKYKELSDKQYTHDAELFPHIKRRKNYVNTDLKIWKNLQKQQDKLLKRISYPNKLLLKSNLKLLKDLQKQVQNFDFGMNGEELAKFMHDEYEKIAKEVGWNTQDKCKVDYSNLPKKNKEVMNAVAVNVMCELKQRVLKFLGVEK
jgi:hypothetical protein